MAVKTSLKSGSAQDRQQFQANSRPYPQDFVEVPAAIQNARDFDHIISYTRDNRAEA